MQDIRHIRENEELYQWTAAAKGIDLSIPHLLEMDDRRRGLMHEIEQLRYARNQASERIGALRARGEKGEAASLQLDVKSNNEKLAHLESEQAKVELAFSELLHLVPNLVSSDTPHGLSDKDNVEVKRVGEPPVLDFEPLDHVTLGELHGMVDFHHGLKLQVREIMC